MANDILKVTDLRKTYGDLIVVDGLTFSVKRGEIFGILGPNGAGKTTTLEMIESLRPADSGTIYLNNINVDKKPYAVREIIGIQLQSSNFYDKVTLEEHIEMYAAIYGRKVDVLELLGRVELRDKAKAYVEQLSGGQKQRFSIAVGLVNNPKVLFLDEPTTGLDPQSRRHLWELIQQIRNDGVTVIITTHYMDEAEVLCDRIAIMDEGKIIALDTPPKLIKALLNRGFKKEVEVHQASLEDVFIDLTGKALRE